jgi:hypothetical protein
LMIITPAAPSSVAEIIPKYWLRLWPHRYRFWLVDFLFPTSFFFSSSSSSSLLFKS